MFRVLGLITAGLIASALASLFFLGSAAAAEPVTNVAHRGASAYAPENTLAAVKLAQRQRADMFEIDVQETKDHELIMMHDTTLTRTTDAEERFPDRAPWSVGDFTLDEIRTLDAGSWFGPEFAGESVPTLHETLRAMRRSGLGLLLEVKAPELYPGIERRIGDELARTPYWLEPDPRERRLVVQSFNWESMRTFHDVLPDVPIGLLGTPEIGDLPDLAEFADQINPRFRDLTTEYVDRVHELDMEVFTWTIDDPDVMREIIGLGVDGIITNRPDVLRDVIGDQARAAA